MPWVGQREIVHIAQDDMVARDAVEGFYQQMTFFMVCVDRIILRDLQMSGSRGNSMRPVARSSETVTVSITTARPRYQGLPSSRVQSVPGPCSLSQGHQAISSEGSAVISAVKLLIKLSILHDYEGVSDKMLKFEQNDEVSVKSTCIERALRVLAK